MENKQSFSANKFLVIANWKANEPPAYTFSPPENIEVAIAPPSPLLAAPRDHFLKAAQDVSRFPEGPETGEVPAKLLAELGVKYCLVGHSERRKLLGETTQVAGEKFDQLVAAGIVPIVCARTQDDIPPGKTAPLTVMYEPEEAISTNGHYHSESPENINRVLNDWQTKLPAGTRFLYGGSVNPGNIKDIITNCPLVTGLVIGHASLDPATFADIIKVLTESLKL